MAADNTVKYCAHCGAQNRITNQFCVRCGQGFSRTTGSPEQTQPESGFTVSRIIGLLLPLAIAAGVSTFVYTQQEGESDGMTIVAIFAAAIALELLLANRWFKRLQQVIITLIMIASAIAIAYLMITEQLQ